MVVVEEERYPVLDLNGHATHSHNKIVHDCNT